MASSNSQGETAFKTAMKDVESMNPSMGSYVATFLASAKDYLGAFLNYNAALSYHNQYPNPSYQTTEVECGAFLNAVICSNKTVTVDVSAQYHQGVNNLNAATSQLTTVKSNIVNASRDVLGKGAKALLELEYAFNFHQFAIPDTKEGINFTVYYQEQILPFLPSVPNVPPTDSGLFGNTIVESPSGLARVQNFVYAYEDWKGAKSHFETLIGYFNKIDWPDSTTEKK